MPNDWVGTSLGYRLVPAWTSVAPALVVRSMALLALVLVLAAATLGAGTAREQRTCPAVPPTGPEVPAPLVLRTSCGGFLLARDGTVTRLPQRWFDVRAGGTGRRYGADLRIRRTASGRIVLGRNGHVVWRSDGLFRRDAGSIAFGPGAFAFAAYRRGIFVTDLRSPERLVVRGVGLYPLAFLGDGTLLVVRGGWGPSVIRVTRDGSVVERHRYRPRNGYVFEERTETLHLVRPDRMLVEATVSGARVVRPLGALDGWLGLAGPFLTLSDFAHEGHSDVIRYAVLQQDGRVVSRWSWRAPQGAGIDSGPTPSLDGGSFGFRTVTRPRGDVVVYLLRAGVTRPAPVLRYRGSQVGCGVGASFAWKGRYVLYSATDGPAAVFDARTRRVVSLAVLQSALSRSRWERPSTHWASDFRRDDARRA